MKTLFLATAAALSLGIGAAYAQESGAQSRGYVYPGYVPAGSIYAGVHTAPPVTTSQNGQAIHAYVAHSRSQGTWLFPTDLIGGGN
jgi:hypothetical protein